MENGYIKLYRAVMNEKLLNDPNALQLYIHLALSATFKQGAYTINGKVHQLNVGDVLFSYSSMAKALHSTIDKMRTALGKLKRYGLVSCTITNTCQVIHLTDCSIFQKSNNDKSQAVVKNPKPTVKKSQANIPSSKTVKSTDNTDTYACDISTNPKPISQAKAEKIPTLEEGFKKNVTLLNSLLKREEEKAERQKAEKPKTEEECRLEVSSYIQNNVVDKDLSKALTEYTSMCDRKYGRCFNAKTIQGLITQLNVLTHSQEEQIAMLQNCIDNDTTVIKRIVSQEHRPSYAVPANNVIANVLSGVVRANKSCVC